MLAKLTSKNQLTLPKSVTDSLGPVQYFEVQVQSGQVVLTPVRIQRGDAVRAKLAELDLGDDVLAQALSWAVDGPSPARAARKSVKAQTAQKPTKASVDTTAKARASGRKSVKAVDVASAEKSVKAAKNSKAAVKAVKATRAKSTAARTSVTKPRRRSAA